MVPTGRPASTPLSRGSDSAGRWLIFDTRRALTLTDGTLLSPSKAGRVIPKWTSEVKTIWMMGWVVSARGVSRDKQGESAKTSKGSSSDLMPKNNGKNGIKGVTLSLIHPEESEAIPHGDRDNV